MHEVKKKKLVIPTIAEKIHNRRKHSRGSCMGMSIGCHGVTYKETTTHFAQLPFHCIICCTSLRL